MKLPPFLRFLKPLFRDAQDDLSFHGHVRVEASVRGGPPVLVHDSKNFIVDLGLTTVRDILLGTGSAIGISGSVFRMAIGDGGTPPGQLASPKLPDATWPARTALYHEVIRQDISSFSKPTPASARFVGSFNSIDVDVTSFSLADRVINEAALIIGDGVLTVGGAKKQVNKVPPDVLDADEKMFSTRCFKSTPFDPAEDVTITVTWTITVLK